MPRELIHEDTTVRIYRVTDDKGKVLGTDQEFALSPEKANETAIRRTAEQALQTLRDDLAAFDTMTAAQRIAAQKRALRVTIGLVRLTLNEFSASD